MSARLLLLPVLLLPSLWMAPQTPPFKSGIEAVRVDALVTRQGSPVLGLTPADFEVFDNGVRQRIDQSAFEDVPINLVIALDTSSSLEGERARHLRSAGLAALDRLRTNDRAAVVTFSHGILVPAGVTHDLATVRRALDGPLPSGDTSLVDAAMTALVLADSQPGRSLLLIFTDRLEVSSYLKPKAVLDATRRSEAVIYAVTLESSGNHEFLRDLTDAGAGEVFGISSSRDLEEAFTTVLDQFRSRYLFSFTPSGVERHGWHRLEVRVKGRDLKVKARPGYFRP